MLSRHAEYTSLTTNQGIFANFSNCHNALNFLFGLSSYASSCPEARLSKLLGSTRRPRLITHITQSTVPSDSLLELFKRFCLFVALANDKCGSCDT